MPSNSPNHLHFSKHLDSNGKLILSNFKNEELIYRCFNGNKTEKYPQNEYFAEISTSEIEKGISVNRSEYCKDHTDVLWRNVHEPINDEIDSCEYSKREGIPIYSIYGAIMKSTPPSSLNILINHSWVKCNIAHCDIILSPKISTLNKTDKRDMRIYLASLFRPIKK